MELKTSDIEECCNEYKRELLKNNKEMEKRLEELEKENNDLKFRLDHVWTRVPRDFGR